MQTTPQYRLFGSLNFEVSPISFGGGGVSGEGGGYGFGPITETQAISLLHEARDLGIRLFDTAPIYGYGTSEIRMGKAFASQRDKVFLVSKSGISWSDRKKVFLSNEATLTERMLEESLKRLQTDYIDLYMIHWPDPKVDIREPMKVLSKAKKAGKIRAIGLSNSNQEDFLKAQEIEKVDVFQSEWSLFQKQARDNLFPLIRQHGVGFMGWGTLDKGILSETVTAERKFDATDARSWAPWWKGQNLTGKLKAVQRIKKRLTEEGYSPLELALGFSLSAPEVSTALCGPKSSTQLRELIQATQHLPPSALIEEAEKICEEELSA